MTSHRIGILGGTFDPVHEGHIAAAREVARELSLDSVLFVPAARPWHKSPASLATELDRLAMLALAVAPNPKFSVSTVDLDRGGDTYTIDTLGDLEAGFAAEYPGDSAEWFFITGADALASLGTWRSPEELLRRATFVAVTRPGHVMRLPDVEGADRALLIEIQGVDISSTQVRERVAAGQSIGALVPAPVVEYIREHGLYRQVGA